jgi:hypothetical protein
VKDLRREARDLKVGVAEQTLEPRLLKEMRAGPLSLIALQSTPGKWMRTTTNEISIVRQSLLAAMRGPHLRSWSLSGWSKDQSPKPKHVWNRVPDEVRRKVVKLALKETELSPRELAMTCTDHERYFLSESTVYCTPKAHDLITSPAFIIKTANGFKDKTSAINQL